MEIINNTLIDQCVAQVSAMQESLIRKAFQQKIGRDMTLHDASNMQRVYKVGDPPLKYRLFYENIALCDVFVEMAGSTAHVSVVICP